MEKRGTNTTGLKEDNQYPPSITKNDPTFLSSIRPLITITKGYWLSSFVPGILRPHFSIIMFLICRERVYILNIINR